LFIVAALFCAPLFIGLGGWDLRSDEAIYSYAVDRIIETGEWLTPRSIQVDGPFLEKPPLKFWMTAALIGAGVVPHDEFGFRFLDALMGAAAFLYIYAFGLRLAGAVCGVAAVLLTFSMDAIVFEHGLRSNNMEAPLMLAYCGGLYHFMRWVEGGRRVRAHALATAACFVLGFMTKFVAVLFLPAIFVATAFAAPAVRRRLTTGWRDWIWPAALTIAAIAPWFVYETAVYGNDFWSVILGLHVFTRFTASLDPGHLAPWHYYFTRTWDELLRADGLIPVLAAFALVAFSGWRKDWRLRLTLLWWLVPVVCISFGTSKLFHYAYPFLPPLGLMTGWAAAELMTAATGSSGRRIAEAIARFQLPSSAQAARTALLVIAVVAIAIAIATAVAGRFEWSVGGMRILQNSTLSRPLLIAALLLALAGRPALSVRTVAAFAIAMLLPVASYPLKVRRVTSVDHRLAVLRDCAARVPDASPGAARGVYNAARTQFNHSHFYYLFRLGSWTEPPTADRNDIRARLFDPAHQTLTLMPAQEYDHWRAEAANGSMPLPPAAVVDGVVIVTPGPYAACASAVVAAGATRPSAG
jgi:4-amino-4-deoxy-L-arabinose transferase-like glycosyltransferase